LRIGRATTDKPLSDLNTATKKDKKRERGILSHFHTRSTVFVTSGLLLTLLLSSFFAVQSNQGAWASTFPGQNGQIAFVRGPPGEIESFEIYVMNDDGSGQTRLTNNDASDGDPSWSPDGSQIAFTSNRDSGNPGVYVMNADDGSDVTRLTGTGADYSVPDWGTNRPTSATDDDDGDDSSTTSTSTSTSTGSDTSSTTTSTSITSTSEQAIDKAISNIQNQDAIPQNMKTDIVTMMEGISNYVNNKIQTTIDQAMAPFFVP
jgi:Tol biopolymer transport system component